MAPVLRPYQSKAIEDARRLFIAGKKSVLLVAATGSGKTVVASAIIAGAQAKGSRTLFLAHRRELVHQTRDKLRSFGVEPGIIMAGERMDLAKMCQVGSVQTLMHRRDALSKVDLIFFDEAHHAAAESYQNVVKLFPDAKAVGLTATPWRIDGQGLSDIFEDHVLVASPAQLRDQGYLCPVGGWQFVPVDTSSAKVQGGDFSGSSMSAAGREAKVLGSIVGEYLARANGKRAVAFCVSVDASIATAQAFVSSGVRAEHIDGTTPREQREAILGRWRSGETQVVCNCNVLTEGFDLPEIELCILARPTLSPSLYLQMVGRALRTHPGKTLAMIHDHARCLATHGHPYEERDFAPQPGESVNKKRKDLSREPRLCRFCGSIRIGWPCGACGASPSAKEVVEDVRANAVEISNDSRRSGSRDSDAERAAKWRNKTHEDKRAVWGRLVAKHGAHGRKAVGVYRWLSGNTEWPPRTWQAMFGIK